MVEKTLSCLWCCNECQVTPLIHKRIWLYLKGWGREVKKSEDFTSSVACEKSASGVGPEQEGHEDRTWRGFCQLLMVVEKAGKLAQGMTWLVITFAEAAAQGLKET